MSVQDKVEGILKQIHVLFSESPSVSGDGDKIIVDKKEVFSILEKLNLSVYEMMDQYEITSQARSLAQQRTEKKGKEIVEKISGQAEDVYAASLIYTDDALNRVKGIMEEAMLSAQEIMNRMNEEFEKEKLQVKQNQSELREQLQDFKDSRKYLVMIEETNRKREKEQKEKEGGGTSEKQISEKRIHNEARHYSIGEKPEIKVNPAYLKRRGIQEEGQNPPSVEESPGESCPVVPVSSVDMPEIYVDLDAEYFKWQAGEAGVTEESRENGRKRFLFGKKQQ